MQYENWKRGRGGSIEFLFLGQKGEKCSPPSSIDVVSKAGTSWEFSILWARNLVSYQTYDGLYDESSAESWETTKVLRLNFLKIHQKGILMNLRLTFL